MKACSVISRGKRAVLAAMFSCCAVFSAEAVQVDTELVILVESRTSPNSDFDVIIEGVARAFEQQSFADRLAAGPTGSIAASVILFNSATELAQGIANGVPWMQLSSTADLQNFASQIRNINNPPSSGNVDYAGAIAAGAAQLASSVFEGSVRQITLIDDGTGFFDSDPNGTRAARDAALASSADVINAVVFGTQGDFQSNAAESFYNANVIGGTDANVEVIRERTNNTPTIAEQTDLIQNAIVTQINPETLSVVPEPSAFALLLVAGLPFLARRKR